MTNVLDDLPSDMTPTPGAVGTYLGVSGWELEQATAAAETWLLTERGRPRARVLLPIDSSYVDFSKRFNEALRRLCIVYDWDSFQLANQIMSSRSDLLRIRADQLIRYDSIPLKQAEQLLTGAVGLMTAAARATVEPRPAYSGRPPGLVSNFIEDDVRMGHTQRGSFVITVITSLAEDDVIPPSEEDAGGDLRESEAPPAPRAAHEPLVVPPFQRRVTSTLANALRETAQLASEDRPVASSSAIDRGVNAQLCESLVAMTKFQGLRALDLGFRWAPAEAISPPEVSHVSFDRDHVEPLKVMTNKLKERQSSARLTVLGRVIKLERSEGFDAENEAVITLRAVVEKKRQRQVRLTVTGADHDLAIQGAIVKTCG